jgi:peptidyl-prolyl cis-trans isomerase-like 3
MSLTLNTTQGIIKLELYCEDVPIACYNFLALCASGYYDGCVFHRNIPGFMVQSGDPTGTGKGGASIYGANFNDEIVGGYSHDDRGVLSMANKGPNTNGSQFFITYDAAPHLDGKYTIFGKVIGGLSTLEKMEKAKTDERDRPLADIVLQNVTIHANPIADEE